MAVLAFAAVATGATGFAPKFSLYADEKGGAMDHPEGVACNDKMVVVADTGNGRLLKFTYEGDALKGGTEIRLQQMRYPTRVQIDSKGALLVFDGRQRKVLKVGADGTFQGYVEPSGLPEGVNIVSLAFKLDSKDNIYLLDLFSSQVFVLDPAGKYLRQVGLPGDAGFITDLCVGAGGEVYVVDAVKAVVYVTDKDFKSFVPMTKGMKQYMSFPMYMTVDEKGALLIVDQDGGGIVTIGQDGSYQGRQLSLGWTEGLLYYPCQVCIGPDGGLVIADRGNSRVQLFSVAK